MIRGPLFSYRIVGSERRYRGAKIEEDRLHLRLLDRGGLPGDAMEAPLASWMLARLIAEAGLGGQYAECSQTNDGGAFSLSFEVSASHGSVIGGFELLGYTWALEMVGRCLGPDPEQVVGDFVDLLLADPGRVSRCRLSVHDGEWSENPQSYLPRPPAPTDRNVYGWEGNGYLGRDNFWCDAEVGEPWPEDGYRGYYDRILAAYRLQAAKLEMPPMTGLVEDTSADLLSALVMEARSRLRSWLGVSDRGIAWVAYDLDGHVITDDLLSVDGAMERLEQCVLEGLDVSWRRHEDQPVIKVWEYPASEPPWSTVFCRHSYRPQVEP